MPLFPITVVSIGCSSVFAFLLLLSYYCLSVQFFLGCAFVRMQTKNDAEKCITQLHNCMTLPVSSRVVLTKLLNIFILLENYFGILQSGVLVLGSLFAPPRYHTVV